MAYSLNLIRNYIIGEDTPGYELEELERDPKFMQEVLRYSKDKNMYELCDDEVKQDYMFTRFVIDEFETDPEFCEKVAETFLSLNEPDDILYRELCVVMCEKFGSKIDLFSLKTLTFYLEEMGRIDVAKENLEESGELDNLGRGFVIVQTEYPGSEAIQSYFAKKIIEEIFFHSEEGSLIKFFHNRFESFEDIEKAGVNNTLLSLISLEDQFLAQYTGAHLDVLDPLKEQLKSIKSTWKYDHDKMYTDRVESFLEEVNDYMEPIRNDVEFIEDDVIDYVVRRLGIEDIMEKYDYTKKVRQELRERLEIEPFDFEHESLSLIEIKCLRDMLQRGRETFKVGILYDSDQKYYNEEEVKEQNLENTEHHAVIIPFKR